MTDLDRFHACMQYAPADRRPNHELGVWRQTRERWTREAPDAVSELTWHWFDGETALGMDRREFISVDYGFIPPFDPELIEETADYEVRRNAKGVVTRALKQGAVGGQRMCMDQYLAWPVSRPNDFADIKRRLVAATTDRYPSDLDGRVAGWLTRDVPLILGHNCAINGFYWRAREWMGTEALSYAWYDYPDLMHEMMAFFGEFVIETSRPVLERIDVEYVTLNEDLSMKNGPLLSPATYRTFILPHLERLVAFFKGHGVRYLAIDTDGDPTALIPLFLDAGVDVIWPIERAAGVSPQAWRRQFGKTLRLWGGVDKRVLPLGRDAIAEHLRDFIPLIEEGGFIPTVDHTVPPDVSWDNFRTYLDLKHALLAGEFGALE